MSPRLSRPTLGGVVANRIRRDAKGKERRMLRKIHLLTLALLAAAIAAPIGQAKPDDPLALSILRERAGGSIAETRSKAVDPLAVSMLRGRGWSASRIYDW